MRADKTHFLAQRQLDLFERNDGSRDDLFDAQQHPAEFAFDRRRDFSGREGKGGIGNGLIDHRIFGDGAEIDILRAQFAFGDERIEAFARRELFGAPSAAA